MFIHLCLSRAQLGTSLVAKIEVISRKVLAKCGTNEERRYGTPGYHASNSQVERQVQG